MAMASRRRAARLRRVPRLVSGCFERRRARARQLPFSRTSRCAAGWIRRPTRAEAGSWQSPTRTPLNRRVLPPEKGAGAMIADVACTSRRWASSPGTGADAAAAARSAALARARAILSSCARSWRRARATAGCRSHIFRARPDHHSSRSRSVAGGDDEPAASSPHRPESSGGPATGPSFATLASNSRPASAIASLTYGISSPTAANTASASKKPLIRAMCSICAANQCAH